MAAGVENTTPHRLRSKNGFTI